MSNILNHNRLPFVCHLDMSEYWDFHLHLWQSVGGYVEGFQDKCLAAYIDTTFDECLSDDGVVSMPNYSYSECVNNGIELQNIGFTGMDNGLIRFDKFTITVEEFIELLTKSVYKIESDDCRLKLNAVNGNTRLYNYSNGLTTEDGIRCAKLNGGFFQGMFMDYTGCEYKVLPHHIGNGWSLEFELKREDFTNDKRTLNTIHPENKGIFFYMGTRAENKWIRYYDTECEFEKSNLKLDYFPVNYVVPPDCPDTYDPCLESEYYPEGYSYETCCDCQGYMKENYMEEAKPNPQPSTVLETNSGHKLDQPHIVEIETENKFVFFDRSCKGVTTETYQEGDTAMIEYIKLKNEQNYFTLFNRSCTGLTVKDYDKYLEANKDYDLYGDLYRNAVTFQIRDDGSVGYKYFVRDCEAENPKCAYKIENEWSNPNVVPYGEWVHIHVRILPTEGGKMMRFLFYVNGKLRLVSRDLEKFNFRSLDEVADKQEGVPFNLSLGGGTQGLADVIYNDYQNLPEYIYPLEKEFGGSFIGYLKSFKFYECSLNFNEINENIRFARNTFPNIYN